MLGREGSVGQYVFLSLLHQLREPRKPMSEAFSETLRHCWWALWASGWAKTVRMVAPTICWEALGTRERAFLMKCTRHLCQEAPTNTASMAPFSPRWASLVTSLTPRRPRATKERRKEIQNAPSSLGPTSSPKTSRSPLLQFTPT